jgi:DNA-binding transcriptional LysR family regulator
MRWNDRIGRRLKLGDLHVLVAVAKHGSMIKAAAALSMSHPVVSRAIGDLEHILGVQLFDRNPRGVALTPFGRAILNRSIAVFDELRSGVEDIEFLADPTAGEVRIGSTSALARSFVTAVIDRLARRHPRIKFHVVTGEGRALYRELEERNVDLLVARTFSGDHQDHIEMEALCDDPYVVAAGIRSPWVRRRRLTLADIVDEQWVLPPLDSLVGSFVVEAFRASGLRPPHPAVLAFPVEVRTSLLETGRFLTIVPRSMLRFPGPHPLIKELPVKLPNTSGPITIFTLKGRTLPPAAQLFLEGAREVAMPSSKALARSRVIG